ncbi:restriction endonuclease subunit S [Falsochrobactrum ovis]|uniref:Type I restriction enzyme S subunit n=1 Tax=Falsochrobactrum ovis TaxID=1293442 RepID=A0A364JT29_9HYPH|nr:restriction endonuclease subunit S [Falsochrobactrum ovis]RAK26791.1 type I restriction enzyme S subunit [Falsochrobactrum ovis]
MSGLAPKLRFKQDDGSDFPEWEEKPFGQAVTRGTQDKERPNRPNLWVIDLEHLESGTGRILSKSTTENSLSQKNVFSSGDILFGKLRPYLKKYARPDFDGVCSSEIWVLSGIEVINAYLFYVVQTSYFNQLANISSGSKMPRSDWETIADSEFSIPSLPEQRKIADFLSSIDAKIDAVKRKLNAFERYKKGLMQQIFAQKIRFKQDDGSDFPDWEEKELNEIAVRCRERNANSEITRVLTNSAVQGVVDQSKYFDKDIANADNLARYYIVQNGDFVYNPRISVSAPVGPIKRNNLGTGVMSPLYTVIRFKSTNTDFYDHYFQSNMWHEYMKSVANYGARHDRMAITTHDFMALPIPFPSLLEQQKIADFLSSVDAKIDAIKTQIDKLEAFKKGLLQQMFV